MEKAIFRDRITGSNSSGAQSWVTGPTVVYCDLIPDDAPQDWPMGPKLVPGQFGIFLEHLYYPRLHGPYAVITAKTPEEAKAGAPGLFRPVRNEDGKMRNQMAAWEVVAI